MEGIKVQYVEVGVNNVAALSARAVHRATGGYGATFAAKGSQLYEALTDGPLAERAKKAKAVYDATTERMKALTDKEKK